MYVHPQAIHRMVEDPWMDGVWVGTDVGVFLHQEAPALPQQYSVRQGLPHPFVWEIAPTPENVWLGLSTGPVVLSKSTRTFQRVHLEDGSDLLDLTRMIFVEGSTVWIGTDTKGLFRVDPGPLVAHPVNNPVNGSRFTNPVMGLGSDGSELFISANGYGLVRWDRTTGESDLHSMALRVGKPLYGRILVTEPEVWIASGGEGVLVYNRTGDFMQEHASPSDVNSPVVYNVVPVGSELWFPTLPGVSRYETRTDSWRYWQGMPWGAGNDIVFHAGTIFVGTTGGYVIEFDRAQQGWKTADWWPQAQMPYANYITTCGRDGSRLLFGTGGGGANYHDATTGRWARVGDEPTDTGKPQDITINSIATDSRSRWFATYNGVAENDRASGRWSYYRTDGLENTTRNNLVKSVALTDNEVWIGSSSIHHPKARPTSPDVWSVGNVARVDRASGVWHFYKTQDGLSGENVTVVAPDGDRVWIGSAEGGLDVLDRPTGLITHVYPTDGSRDGVFSILVQGSTVWVGAAFGGLVKVDATTRTAQPVPGMGNRLVLGLAYDDGQLWGGTAKQGLFRFDVASQQPTFFTTGMKAETEIHCALVDGPIVYAGTGWGLERFERTTQRWLPQIVVPGRPEPPPPSEVALAFSAPQPGASVPADSALAVRGTAKGPSEAYVEVRLDSGDWTRVQGLSEWTGSIDVDGASSHDSVLAARLRTETDVLAQAAIDVRVLAEGQDASAGASGTAPTHRPVLEAVQDDIVQFEVGIDPSLTDVVGHVYFTAPGAQDAQDLPMTRADARRLVADTPPLNDSGTASYYVVVEWKGGRARFPEPFSGFGQVYLLEIHPHVGLAAALIVGDYAEITVAPGSDGIFNLTLQNTGTRSAQFMWEAKGDAASWVVRLPDASFVGPSESRQVGLQISVPPGTALGKYPLAVSVNPTKNVGLGYQSDLTINVGMVDDAVSHAQSKKPSWIPAPPASALLVLVALMVLLVRRRQGT